MTAITTHLTERARSILQLLSTKQPYNLIDMIKGLGLQKNGSSSDTVKYNISVLVESGLAAVHKDSSDGACTRWSITQDGLDALQASKTEGFVYAPTAAAKEVPAKIATGSMSEPYIPKIAQVRPGADDHKRCNSLMTGSRIPTNNTIQPAPEPIMVTKQIPAAPAKKKRVDEDYSTPYKPPVVAEVQTPKKPEPKLSTTKESSEVAVTSGLDLEITDDPLPKTKVIFAYKYDEKFSAMRIGQSLKCATADVGKIAGAMRKFVERKGLKAIVRSTPDYGDGYGRVWLLGEKGA